MTQEQWTAVDAYIAEWLVPPDPVLESALAASLAADLPQIQVAPNQGKLLYLLALTIGARAILEIGTLGGYSTIWLARALPPGGSLITLELNPTHADVARQTLGRAEFDGAVDLRVGAALDLLPQLVAEERGPFDLVFVDADKANIAAYFDWSLRLARPGSLIVLDNVVRSGRILDANSEDPNIQGVRRLYERLAGEPRVTVTAIQTVGSKGYDGLAIARVNDT